MATEGGSRNELFYLRQGRRFAPFEASGDLTGLSLSS